jgi:hypothetical protein
MSESILHYIWQHKLFSTVDLKTTDNELVEIISIGQHNTDAGPDFFNAKIKIGDTLWAGNVEIHKNSSDWNKHKHHENEAYNSVVLHVVEKADIEIFRKNGKKIPQLELIIPKHIAQNYTDLLADKKWIACADRIVEVPQIFIETWKNALLTERLEQKTEVINALLKENENHWEESFYIVLARNFGFGTNSQAFEELAKSLPLNVLAKHKNDLFQLESLFFGQADLLPKTPSDDYTKNLIKEYAFLKAKYGLQKKLDLSRWKLLRLRPDNFPHIRIAQFASLIHSSSKLFSKIIETPEIEYLRTLFACEVSDYWKTHYTFSSEKSTERTKKLGKQSVDTILINTVVPFLFAYASQKDNADLKEKAEKLLEKIPAERNSIITNWKNIGINCRSAYDSQALLQLKKMYCDEKKCIRCRIGHKVLTLKTTLP